MANPRVLPERYVVYGYFSSETARRRIADTNRSGRVATCLRLLAAIGSISGAEQHI